MSRLLLLPPFILWVAWLSSPVATTWHRSDVFLGVYALLVLGLVGWNRYGIARLHRGSLYRHNERMEKAAFIARVFVPAWFAAGLYLLGWGDTVVRCLGPVAHWPVKLPGTILGTLPAVLAWAGIIWSQYPAEMALREQGMLDRVDSGLPVTLPPSLWTFMVGQMRMSLGFTVLPVLAILGMKDVLFGGAALFGLNARDGGTLEIVTTAAAVAIVFPLAPELMRRVLKTRRLPEGPIRRRLQDLFARTRLRCRDVLLWETDSSIGNAMVMGVLPRMRYILLSDLMMQTMSDEQIEAVFAHEVGHIMHRHLAWNVVLVMLACGVADAVDSAVRLGTYPDWLPVDVVSAVLSIAAFVAVFGWILRRFERQADVYAARVIQAEHAARAAAAVPVLVAAGGEEIADAPPEGAVPPLLPPVSHENSHVGPHGAAVFASTLRRIADVNNMRTTHKPWTGGNAIRFAGYLLGRLKHATDNYFHGSIESRARYLIAISRDPAMTHRFDRFMVRLYAAMLLLLALFGAGSLLEMIRG